MFDVSQSQINLFRMCPHAYELNYKYHKEPIRWDPSIFEVGSSVHDASDIYYKKYWTGERSEEEVRDLIYSILRNDWNTFLPAKSLAKAYKCICNLAKFEINNRYKGRTKPLTEIRIPEKRKKSNDQERRIQPNI